MNVALKNALKGSKTGLVTGAALLLCAANAHYRASAVPLAAGASVGLSGTTNAARPELAGVVLVDRIRNFSMTNAAGATIRGTFQDRVVKRNASGQLEFSFRIKNDASSAGNIVVVNRQKYGAFSAVDVDFRLDGLGSVGALAAAHGGGPNARIKFDFYNAPIKPGAESRFHFIGTTATEYNEKGLIGLQSNNGAYTSFKVFSPKKGDSQNDEPKKGLPNLKTKIIGPSFARAGQDISNQIKVRAFNTGDATAPGTSGTLSPANGFMIDVMLSKDEVSPAGYAIYSPSYSDDVLLLGGRISNTRDLAAGGEDSYPTGATIPADTPPGNYFLAVRIDSGNKVDESNEGDNTYYLPIKIVAPKKVRID